MRYGLILVLALIAVGVANTGQAEFVFLNLHEAPADVVNCAIAAGDEGDIVAAWEANDSIWTRNLAGGRLQEIVTHGPGITPTVAYGRDGGFLLAFGRDDLIVVKEGDVYDWTVEHLVYSSGNTSVKNPDFMNEQRNSETRWPWLTWEDDDGWIYFSMDFAYNSVGIAIGESASGNGAYPQLSWKWYEDWQLVPRIFFGNGMYIYSMYFSYDGWTEPEMLYDSETGGNPKFDVATEFDDGYAFILSKDWPYTCYCNDILYYRELPSGDFSMPESILISEDNYTMPYSPTIALDTDWTVHTFWHAYHTAGRDRSSHSMHYLTRGSYWTDRSYLLQGHVGSCTAMALTNDDNPVFIWAEQTATESERDPILAFDGAITAAATDAIPAIALKAFPNPFNPQVTLSARLPEAGNVTLEIIDLRGRVLRTLLEGHRDRGVLTVSWDGLDEKEVPAASGVYFARLQAAGRIESTKLMLLR